MQNRERERERRRVGADFSLSGSTKIERKKVNGVQVVNQILGNLGAVTNGLFRSIKRFPSAL
jgi:hypothetical protein